VTPRTGTRWQRCAAAAACAGALAGCAAGAPEARHRIDVTVQDLRGRVQTVQIPVAVYRPDGAGPFPLVIFNHGRAIADARQDEHPETYRHLVSYLVDKGFVVLLPTRAGYGETFGGFDPEAAGRCNALRPEVTARASSDQVLQTLEFAKTLPYVDASRWLVVGQSVGGLASVATVARHPAGLIGGINFSGGTGGNPKERRADPCSPDAIARLWKEEAAGATVPMLWLYWQNDLFFGVDAPKRWHQAWTAGGGQAEFHQLPAFGNDGHSGLRTDITHWRPYVDAWLAQLGFGGPVARPGPP
jgi:dienelactone hydrolase